MCPTLKEPQSRTSVHPPSRHHRFACCFCMPSRAPTAQRMHKSTWTEHSHLTPHLTGRVSSMLKLEIPSKDGQIPLNAKLNLRTPHPADHARLQILVPRIPELGEFSFEQRHDIWYAEKDGIAMHFCWHGPENAHGFGGRHFNIHTAAGEEVILKGPWSTRAGVVNAEGLGPCVDVSLTDDPGAFHAGTRSLPEASLLTSPNWPVRSLVTSEWSRKARAATSTTRSPVREISSSHRL